MTIPNGAREVEAVIAAPGVTPDQRAVVWLAPGSDADENTADMIDVTSLAAAAETDALRVFISFAQPEAGPLKLFYQVI